MRKTLAVLLISALIFVGCTTTTEQTPNETMGEEDAIAVEWCFVEPQQEKDCYDTEVAPGTNAYTSLSDLANTNENVEIEATDYGSDLGYFVTSINGVEGDAENFWKLFVDGTEANVGISSVIIEEPVTLTMEYTAVE